MVGIGMILLATAVTGAVLRCDGATAVRNTLVPSRRDRNDTAWFPRGLAGWTVTEAGRQPLVIYGHLRTVDAAAPVTAGAVTTSLLDLLPRL